MKCRPVMKVDMNYWYFFRLIVTMDIPGRYKLIHPLNWDDYEMGWLKINLHIRGRWKKNNLDENGRISIHYTCSYVPETLRHNDWSFIIQSYKGLALYQRKLHCIRWKNMWHWWIRLSTPTDKQLAVFDRIELRRKISLLNKIKIKKQNTQQETTKTILRFTNRTLMIGIREV